MSFTVQTIPGPNGTILPLGSATVLSGDNLTLSIVPFEGYRVLDVLVDSLSVGDVTSYTFSSISADHVVEASFMRSDSYLVSQYSVSSGIDVADPATYLVNRGIESKAHFVANGTPSKVVYEVTNGLHSAKFVWDGPVLSFGHGTWDPATGTCLPALVPFPATSDRYWFTVQVIGERVFLRVKGSDMNHLQEGTLNTSYNLKTGWQVKISSVGRNPAPSGVDLEDFYIRGDEVFVAGLAVEYLIMSSDEIANKYVDLSSEHPVVNPAVNLTEGTTQIEGVDFVMVGDKRLSWDGLGLETILEDGDGLRVIYMTGGPDTKDVHLIGRTIVGLREV